MTSASGFTIQWAAAFRFRRAKAKLASGRRAQAAGLLTRAAKAGHAEAAYELARLYESGKGVICDLSMARHWAKSAADAGFVPAMALLARLYLLTPHPALGSSPAAARLYRGATKLAAEPEAARTYAVKAADAGNFDGMALAGYLYASGIGGEICAQTALGYYRPAAGAGQIEAHLGLGTLLAGGHVGAPDYLAARLHFRIASDGGNLTARHYLALQLLKGLGGEQDERGALRLLHSCAVKGYRASIEELAKFYLAPGRTDADKARGIRWLSTLGRMGDRRACRDLEQRYRHGIDVTADAVEALFWLEKAALCGDTAAQFQMAVAAATGAAEVSENHQQARHWFAMAARSGHTIAMINLGRFLMKGIGGPVELAAARVLLEDALAAGELAALSALGEFYGFHADPPEPDAARRVLQQGADLEDALCRQLLQRMEHSQASRVA